ncbi:Histone-lysine N-methyltransferase [Actinidia chinensis var. chinensis]|uniref:Histone-lysine N-methyltransferase n=1 Tax=Actinidia chinensis var. chinensis TaxID=1590841 RepID=A0A2R6QMM7_ACTCC|nr:Histone-lysine N-methyltransferase [Actinidia chinensis var. chinensis]
MDNYWEAKCSSTWQSLTPSVASSSQLQPQEPRNQVSNAGLYFHPHVAQSADREMIQEAMVSKTSNLSSDNSVHADPGNSFLSLFSGPPSLLQRDLHQFSSPKPFVMSSKVPVSSSSFTVGATGSGVSLACNGMFSQNLSIQYPKIGEDLCPVVSSRYGSSFSLLDVLHVSNGNHHSSEPAKAVIFHSDSGYEKVRDFSALISSSANDGKPQSTSTQTSLKAPLEIKSPISSCSSTLPSPRVFCLGSSGDLLLSNTGLLGVVCSCHGLHMSISKFSEHSGLGNVNPGDCVHMDSGETIAQWRKLYFHKFGIRVPDDHNGWDWLEGFSTTSGMVKHSVTASNMSKNSDRSNPVGSCGGLEEFRQHQNNVAFLRNHNTGQKLVNEVSCNGQRRHAQDGCNLLHKGLIGVPQNNFPAVVDNQTMAPHMSGARVADNDCHSLSAFGGSLSKSVQSFISYENLQKSKFSHNDSDINRHYNLKKGNNVDTDAVSSGTELRLGQPSPQSQTSRSPVSPAFRSHHPFDTRGRGDPQKSRLSEQCIHYCNSSAMEDHSQTLQRAAGSSNACVEGQTLLNLVNLGHVINNARDATIIENLKSDVDRSWVLSKLLSQFKTPIDGRMQSTATGGLIDGCHVLPRTLPCESHIAKYDPTSSPWNRGYATEALMNINKFSAQKHVDNSKEVAFVVDSLRVATQPNFEFTAKHMGSSTNCDGVGGTGCRSCLVVNEKSSHPYHFSGMPPDAFDPRNPVNPSGKIPFLGLNGHLDHGFLKSASLPKDSGSAVPLQSVSMGFSAPTPTFISNMSPALTTKESNGINPYFLDENLRALAFRHVTEVSNQGHGDASFGKTQDQGRLRNSCIGKTHGFIVDPSSSKEHRHGLAVTNKQATSEVTMKVLQSGFTRWMNGDTENIAPAAGLSKCCTFSTSLPGTSLHSNNIEMQCELSCDMHPTEQPLERSARIENDVTPSNECGKCCRGVPFTYFSGKGGCTTHTNCFRGNSNSRISASKEWTGSLNGMASMSLYPKSERSSTFAKEKAICFDQSGSVEGQVKKKADCHTFQWRDVPSKATGMYNMTCKDRPANLLNRREYVGDQIADVAAAAKCFDRSVHDAESSKEQEMSNISGSSEAAVTQVSVEFNKLDSSTIGAGNKHTQNLVVDEGSGIGKCWSSDDPLDSERSSEFFGFTYKINSASEGSSQPSSRSLIDELRLRDSLILKNVRNQSHTALSFPAKINPTQNPERGFKFAKGERPTKGKIPDASFSPSGIDGDHWNSRSAKDMLMRLQPDLEGPHNCACAVGPSFKQSPELCLTKTVCHKRELNRFYNDNEGENGQTQLTVEDDCLEIPKNSCKKKFRSDQMAPTIKKLRVQEPNCAVSGIHSKSNSANFMIISSSGDNCACSVGSSVKQRSELCLTKTIYCKRELHKLYNDNEGENDEIQLNVQDGCLEIPENSSQKRFRSDQTAPTSKKLQMQEPNCADTGIHARSNSAGCVIISSTERLGICEGKARPVVCGKYGVISNGDPSRPAKIVSLKKILIATRRYKCPKNDQLKLSSANSSKKSIRGSNECIDKFSKFKEGDSEGHVKQTETAYFPGDKECGDVLYALKERDYGCEGRIPDSCISTRLKPKCKAIRKRSLYELSIEGKESRCVVPDIKTSKCLPETQHRYLAKFLKNGEDGKRDADGICTAKFADENQCQAPISHLDAFCCVCGSSNKDELNYLLECGQCFIRVHQACYGVSKVPRGRWYCRPCKTNSKHIVCVLCGYGGGAMTLALRSGNIVKSLLKAWNIIAESGPKDTICPSEVLENGFSMLSSLASGLESYSFRVIRPVSVELSASDWKMDLQKELDCVKNSACSSSNLNMHNSITAGVTDSTIKQWVHMVCGLWTPGTRCPNVNTMSAFDVSGAFRPKANVVCSMCNRPGGSCVPCRIRNCSVQFHPWCAHQKGLLQSEVEGTDNGSVGFYGRCVLHAAYNHCDRDGNPIKNGTGTLEREYTCARTEGYKGRKREGFRHNLPSKSNSSGGCIVPQEQLNAWLHINRQKSNPKGLPKLPVADVEYDCRKEYARYKQSKCWKHLVVYKSGIHALGLYTPHFISRGAMVVEYIGEIVGLRVADKRESDYQSGRKLQYKSACYFFRIDKEHIIDATRKGGIARFVNHSCLPNCVAKVISVRNEKKVVFFAERDIYPGEEITYDYHFNHEDEGEKIPCFCNSKNCRRYLN